MRTFPSGGRRHVVDPTNPYDQPIIPAFGDSSYVAPAVPTSRIVASGQHDGDERSSAPGFKHIRAALAAELWAMEPQRLNVMLAVIERRIMNGQRLSAAEIATLRGDRDLDLPNGQAAYFGPGVNGGVELYHPPFDAACGADALSRLLAEPHVEAGSMPALAQQRSATIAARRATSGSPAGGDAGTMIAVISISGIIAQHASQVDGISGPGGTSTERVGASLRAAMADPSVKAIVLNVNSGGGAISGVQALADQIHNARGTKPIVAQVNSLAASAAYWIACAADEIVMTPGAQAGSIGVYAIHEDVSGALARAGVKLSFISAGKYKTEGNPYEPLSDEARAYRQEQVNDVYVGFVRSVARGRNTAPDRVHQEFGQGRALAAEQAVKVGMADRVATLQQTLQRLAAGSGGGQSTAPSRATELPRGPVAYGAPMPSAGVERSPDEARKRRFTSMVGMSGPARVSGPKATAPQTAADRDHMRRRRFRQRVLGIRD